MTTIIIVAGYAILAVTYVLVMFYTYGMIRKCSEEIFKLECEVTKLKDKRQPMGEVYVSSNPPYLLCGVGSTHWSWEKNSETFYSWDNFYFSDIEEYHGNDRKIKGVWYKEEEVLIYDNIHEKRRKAILKLNKD